MINILRDYIYLAIKDNSIIHASFHRWEVHAKSFPIDYNSEYNFVGEYIYHDGSRSESHINFLKESLHP
jgi:DNA-binding ferritin-like protein (Dps family)